MENREYLSRHKKSLHSCRDGIYEINPAPLKSSLFDLTLTFLLYYGRPWKQRFDKVEILVIHVLWDHREKHFKVLIRVQVVGLCSLYKTVDHRAGFSPMVGLDQHEVLPADREGTDGLLGRLS